VIIGSQWTWKTRPSKRFASTLRSRGAEDAIL
jgi:hypothetical protein